MLRFAALTANEGSRYALKFNGTSFSVHASLARMRPLPCEVGEGTYHDKRRDTRLS